MTWDVGLGDKALFLEDSWDGFPPIPSTPSHKRLKRILSEVWGDKVIDYKVKYDLDGIQKWRWHQVESLGLDPDLVKAFKEITSERCIKQLERSDSLIWEGSKDGRYIVKQGYKVLVNSQSWKKVEMPLKLCWDTTCLPKAGFSLWLSIQNRVLTAKRLTKFRFIGPS